MPVSGIDELIAIAGGPGTVRTVFDVGANDGADSLPLARAFPNIRFIAVEPTPELARKLKLESTDLHNYTVLACAVGRSDGVASLKIRRKNVHNSLEDIDPSSVAGVGRDVGEFDVQKEITVPVRTLKSLCEELDVKAIDVLHVDAQGSDLDILISAGDLLETVEAGVVEAARRLHLYSNSVSRRRIVRFLTAHGFHIVRVSPNDRFNLEQNVFFARATDVHWTRMRAVAKMARAEITHWTAPEAPLRWFLFRARLALRARLRRAVARSRQ